VFMFVDDLWVGFLGKWFSVSLLSSVQNGEFNPKHSMHLPASRKSCIPSH
jgi:hypothetical protein